ncbi:hypothetical protein N789_08680 [Arenimonas oryziterrae DSM 21050 = YC6267]|uniref:Uncharacterized protein n=2 Tax=Arenimonas TaxID=490567 RepID=A0A091AXE4_9GAMM|nr:hypothetical protein N789_08680 [Arenimonas oryziterrae DSM 21050 = YC6267]
MRWLVPGLALIVVFLAMTAAWLAVALYTGQASGWMALVTAADLALMLRITRAPSGVVACLLAVAATVVTTLAAYWMITATYLGGMFGLGPLDSAMRLGPVLASELTWLTLERADWWAIGCAPVLAAIASFWLIRRD